MRNFVLKGIQAKNNQCRVAGELTVIAAGSIGLWTLSFYAMIVG